LSTEPQGEIRRDHEFTTERGPFRAQAGIRIRLAGIDPPKANLEAEKPAGAPARPRENRPARAPEARPILAEIVDDGRIWRLTADLPGATREDLDLSIGDGHLVIAARTRTRRFADRVALPASTELSDLRVSLQNGILEVEAPSAERSAL
jgi:HSP20 family molecular chaperone IbpA